MKEEFLNILKNTTSILPFIWMYYAPEHEWHELEMTIQVIMSYEDNLRMLNEYPELAVYCKENNIERHVENGFVYIYANFLLEEHEEIIKKYNAIINIKS